MSFTGHFLQYKNLCKHIPAPFLEAWQLCTKGPSGSSILGSFWAPHHSTSINVFELFFCGTAAFWYVYQKAYPLSTSSTPDCVAEYNKQVAVGKIITPLVRQVEPVQKK